MRVFRSNGESRHRRARARGERGAALVEFALVAPFLFLLLFGIIEFGLSLNDYQSLRQGVREGARNGVVADYGSTTSCGLNGSAASVGGTGASNTKALICSTKSLSGLGNDVRVNVIYTADSTGFDSERVKVCAVYDVNSITGFLEPALDDVFLKTEIEMRAEKDLELVSTSETDPSGSSWSWCT